MKSQRPHSSVEPHDARMGHPAATVMEGKVPLYQL
jgi:hypothetical protein